MKYKVNGKTTVIVTTEVVADSAEDALEVAYNELTGLICYAGNGGSDKLIGVDGENESVSAEDEIEWTSAEQLESDEDD